MRELKLDWIVSEEDRRQVIEANRKYEEAGSPYHLLMAYHALIDEIWLKQNPEDASPWTNDHQPSVLDSYF